MVYTYVLKGEKTIFMLWAYVSVFLHSVLFGGTFKLSLFDYFEFDCLSFPDYRPVNTTLIINTGDRSVILNQTFTITCDTQANPPATYEIFRDDGNKVGSNSVVTTSVTEVEENNSVTFTCKASNGYGDGPTAKITLEVYCKCNGFESVC